MVQHLHTASWPNRSINHLHPKFYTCVLWAQLPVKSINKLPNESDSKQFQALFIKQRRSASTTCKPIQLIDVIQWLNHAGESSKLQPCSQDLFTLKFGADTGNSILVFLANNTRVSVTAREYGLPFNSHSEREHKYALLQANPLDMNRDSSSAITYIYTAGMKVPLPSAEKYMLECLLVFAESFHQQKCKVCLPYSAHFIL